MGAGNAEMPLNGPVEASPQERNALPQYGFGADVAFEQLIDLCGMDYQSYKDGASPLAEGPRFAVVVHLLSLTKNWRLRLRVFCPDDDLPAVASVTPIWKSANWFEREAFDLYGIVFDGHEDLRRILTDYGFEGHPFRKDFPLTGHVELRYSEEAGRVVYEPVKLAQDFRRFDFLSPWEGNWKLPGDEKAEGAPSDGKGGAA